MSAPDTFLLMDHSAMEALVRILHDVFADRSISRDDKGTYISDEFYYFNVYDFDLDDYILFSSECDNFDEILGLLQRFEKPHVCCISTRDIAGFNDVALALHREVDFVMENDRGLLIDKQTFLRLYADGIDWLRLSPGR